MEMEELRVPLTDPCYAAFHNVKIQLVTTACYTGFHRCYVCSVDLHLITHAR